MSSHEKELANGSSNDQEDPSATVVMALDKVIVKSGKVNTPERNQIGDQTSTEHAIIQQPEDQDNDSGSDDEEEEEDTAAMMPAEGVDAAYAQHNSPAVEGQESDSMSNDDEGEKSDEEASNTLATKRKGGLGGNWMEEDTASATGSEQDDAEGDTNGNEDGSDSEEEDEEDEEDEEEEPSLKYSRLGPASSEILIKDTASALAASSRYIALGTHNGMVHILTYEGSKINSYRPHGASITDIKIDEESDFVATASMEGRVVIRSSTSPEIYAFDQKRPLRAVALEPNFAKKSTKAFVCGGMAGTLVMYEKGWLGHKETVLHSGEGPIWAIEWRGNLIAWANDKGIKIYDTSSSQRIAYIDRPANSPRADVFKPTLYWEDDKTLLVAWADYIKIACIRERPRPASVTGGVTLTVEITAIFRVDCMISGICPYKNDNAFLVLAYVAPDTFSNEATENPMEQRRKAANRPELRIISRKGEEVSSDALSLSNYHLYGCNDYLLMPSGRPRDEVYLVVSPKDLVVSRPRDQVDHINWLVDQRRFEEALSSAEKLVEQHGESLDIKAIGVKYIKHLFDEGSYEQAARLCLKVFGQDGKIWEDWIFLFIQRGQFPTIIPYVPTKSPRLARLIYDMIMAHFLTHDKEGLLNRIKEWPIEIYDIQAVIVAVQGELDSAPASPILMECLAELYIAQHQPAKALPFLIRLRKPEVFEFISLHNLFSAVQDQVLLLVDFDRENIVDNGDHPIVDREHEKEEMALASTEGHTTARHGQAIALLVEHTYSIPINRVVTQLEERPRYLHMYLDGLFRKDPSLAYEYSDLQVRLYAEYDYSQLMGYLRASNYYSLEKAYEICTGRDFVPEMVFLLGRMGNNKQALMLIIERLGDVQRAIDFAREQADEDLWEDLLRYSESKPAFMRGLLENAGADINPLRIIRRIKDDLEVPGLKDALVKILQASNLQVSLLEGCQKILAGDTSSYASQLQRSQTNGAFATGNSRCLICDDYLFKPGDPDTAPLALAYLCRHMVHASCALPDKTIELPERPDPLANFLYTSDERNRNIGPGRATAKNLGAKLAYSATIRVRVKSCPVCEKSKGSQVRLKAVR